MAGCGTRCPSEEEISHARGSDISHFITVVIVGREKSFPGLEAQNPLNFVNCITKAGCTLG